MSQIKDSTRSLADMLKGHMTHEAGTISIPAEAVQASMADFDVTPDMVTSVQKHQAAVTNAFALAAGEIGNIAMQENADLKQVTGGFQYGKTNISTVQSRESQIPVGGLGGERATAYGQLVVQTTMPKSTELTAIRQHLREQGKSLFGA